MVKATGRVDVTFNGITAVPQPGTQGIPIAELSVDAFIAPITLYLRSHFLTARAAARRMAEQGSGVLLIPDLGSAVLSARSVLAELDQDNVVLSDAPFVEGAVSAGVAASTGADLAAVVRAAEEARDARKL